MVNITDGEVKCPYCGRDIEVKMLHTMFGSRGYLVDDDCGCGAKANAIERALNTKRGGKRFRVERSYMRATKGRKG